MKFDVAENLKYKESGWWIMELIHFGTRWHYTVYLHSYILTNENNEKQLCYRDLYNIILIFKIRIEGPMKSNVWGEF